MGKSGDTHRQRIRSKIQESIERAEEERKRELFRRRIELARSGVLKYKGKHFPDAVRSFHTYIRILEEFKGVGDGGLRPTLFDIKNDLPEILLISGVYWDLAKLYDRTRTPERQREFRHYLEKFVVFSKGMPFQAVSTETLRRYIASDKPVHKQPFKDAYKALGGSNCFIASVLVDQLDIETVPRLRHYRDAKLMNSFWGRGFVRIYYRFGPAIARVVEKSPRRVRSLLGRTLDEFARSRG